MRRAAARVVINRSLQTNWDRLAFSSEMRYTRCAASVSSAAVFSTTTTAFTASSSSKWVQISSVPPAHGRLSTASINDRCLRRGLHAHSQAATNEEDTDASTAANYATTYHAPVMAKECIDALLGIGLDGDFKKTKMKKQRKMRKKDRKMMEQENGSANMEQVGASSTSFSNADTDSTALSQQHDADRPPMLFVDGTLGGGGHSAALLERLRPGDVVFGCDVDPSALSAASERLHRFTAWDDEESSLASSPLFVPVQSNFRDLADILPTIVHPVTGKIIMKLPFDGDDGDYTFVGVDGMLLDLGVSSHQIDTADRGFAFMKDGPLDMRMWGGEWSSMGSDSVAQNAAAGARGLNAADICNEFDEAELTRILRVYGDEPRARKIATAIVNARPLATTSDLVEAVSSVVPEFAKKGRRMGRTATLARVFQSLRIVVNEEDEALVDVFEHAAPELVRPGGRLVVLSYHSMEDRATKRVIRDGSVRGTRGGLALEKDVYGNIVGPKRPWKPLGKKRKASDEEVEVNSRARSATLRIGERQQ